ncbi:MAG: hypothetical protein WCE44_12350 [Candidatus Velthaea sp.]
MRLSRAIARRVACAALLLLTAIAAVQTVARSFDGALPLPGTAAPRTFPPAWEAFSEAWPIIAAYRARIAIFEQAGLQTQQVVFDYDFRKPMSATMHVVEGPNSGVTLEWGGGTTVIAHRGSGLLALFKRTFSLHDPQATTIRGSSIDQLSFGSILDHGFETAGAVAQTDGPTIDGLATDEVRLIPANPAANSGLTLEIIDLSRATHFPVHLSGYEGVLLVRTIDFSNVVIEGAAK